MRADLIMLAKSSGLARSLARVVELLARRVGVLVDVTEAARALLARHRGGLLPRRVGVPVDVTEAARATGTDASAPAAGPRRRVEKSSSGQPSGGLLFSGRTKRVGRCR